MKNILFKMWYKNRKIQSRYSQEPKLCKHYEMGKLQEEKRELKKLIGVKN